MARPGITYEQVQAAAEGLLAKGDRPVIRLIRERLGDTGSPNTIHKHLVRWREAHPDAQPQAPDLSPTLAKAIGAEIESAVRAATTAVNARLVDAQAEAAALSAAGQLLENECEALTLRVNTLTSERDRMSGVVGEQSDRIAQMRDEIERERGAAMQAKTDLAVAKARLEQAEQRLVERGAEIERLRAELAAREKGHGDADARQQPLPMRVAQKKSPAKPVVKGS